MKVLQRDLKKVTNFFTIDDALHKILETNLEPDFLDYAKKELEKFGALVAGEIDQRAKYTDRKEGEPRLVRYNEYGEEVSEIVVNEGYKKTAEQTYNTGIVGYVHKEIPELKKKGNYIYSYAQGYLLSHAEAGFYCPVTLTMATAYLLDHYADEELKAKFLPHVCATGDVELYEGATFLSERQGGSDVGANILAAKFDGENYRLYGEKYFASNAGMCGVAMVLARLPESPPGTRGLTLFAVPWKNDDGTLNNLRIRRLKEKLGVKAVPSAEVEFDGSIAFLVGDPTRGINYMLEALNLSRVCNAIASVGIMKRAFIESLQFVSHREAFGEVLTNYPMIQESIGHMAAKLNAELITVFDLIKLYDKVTHGKGTKRDIILNRLNIAIMKKETAEQSVNFASEAIELHGGNGYMEDFVTPRLLRDAQVLTVWEGTANILALEVIRLINKHEAHKVFIEEMKERVSKVVKSNLKQIVEEKIEETSKILNHFASLDEKTKTIEGKRIAEKMAMLYESVVSLEWAEVYGGKYEKLAEIYLEDAWGLHQFGEIPKAIQNFQDVI